MVTRKEFLFKIDPNGTRFINVPASCINAGLDIPSKKDSFRGVKKVPGHIRKFLRETDGCSAMMVQAGVWALTDDLSGEEIKRRLTNRDSSGRRYNSINDYDIADARQVLARMGIQSRL